MARQITLDDLHDEFVDAAGRWAADACLDVVRKHLDAGDRIKLTLAPPTGVEGLDRVLYQVGDPDPTPARPPWCMAQVSQPGLWDYCTWRPDHEGPHVSGASGKINAVFDRDEVSGWHEYAGLTDEQIDARRTLSEIGSEIGDERDVDPPPSEGRPMMESPLTFGPARQDKNTEGELATEIRMISERLVAITERLEK